MRTLRSILCLLVIAASSVWAQSASRSSVILQLRVTDGAGLAVRDLTPDEIEIRIGGRRQTVQQVQSAPTASVLLLLDVTTSIGSETLDTYVSLVTFLRARVAAPRITVFDTRMEIVPDFGVDRAAAVAFFRDIVQRPRRQTRLWDILMQTIERPADSTAPLAVVVVTDGVDVASVRRYHEVLDRALARRVQVHGIQIRSAPAQLPPHLAHLRGHTLPAPGDFKRLAGGTGGSFVELKANARVLDAVSAALDDIDDQIEVHVDASGLQFKKHDLRVRVTRRNLTVRAPTSIVLTETSRPQF